MLDRTFAKEIKQINGDYSREAKFAFLRSARAAVAELSSPEVAEKQDGAIRKYGRATIGICLAVTIYYRRDRLSQETVAWADEVLKLWENRPRDMLTLYINDNLHPTRIEEYAHNLIKYTTE